MSKILVVDQAGPARNFYVRSRHLRPFFRYPAGDELVAARALLDFSATRRGRLVLRLGKWRERRMKTARRVFYLRQPSIRLRPSLLRELRAALEKKQQDYEELQADHLLQSRDMWELRAEIGRLNKALDAANAPSEEGNE